MIFCLSHFLTIHNSVLEFYCFILVQLSFRRFWPNWSQLAHAEDHPGLPSNGGITTSLGIKLVLILKNLFIPIMMWLSHQVLPFGISLPTFNKYNSLLGPIDLKTLTKVSDCLPPQGWQPLLAAGWPTGSWLVWVV